MATPLQEPQALNAVRDFHELFGAYVGDTHSIPSEEICTLRINLLQEELNELSEGIKNKDIVEIADALADLQYVLSGAVLAFGLHDTFADLFAEVQRSNMSKACKTIEEAKATAAYYRTEKQVESTIVQKDDVYIVLRTGDQKVLKSINYTPAQLSPLVHPQQTHDQIAAGIRTESLQLSAPIEHTQA